MKVAVFGASGFVGRNLVERLTHDGYECRAVDIQPSTPPLNVEFMKTDVLSLQGVEESLKGCDIIFHLAASSLTRSLEDPRRDVQVNVGGTVNILEAARHLSIRKIIFSSASSVYGRAAAGAVKEEHGCTPLTPYAVSKLACEHYLRVYSEVFGLKYIVFRFFNVYGPWQHPESRTLVPNVMAKVVRGDKIQIYGDGSQMRDYIYVDDVVKYLVKALSDKGENMIFNLGTGVPTSVLKVVEVCGRVASKAPNIEFLPPRPGEISNFWADTSKLFKTFGEEVFTSLEEGLTKTYSWIKGVIK